MQCHNQLEPSYKKWNSSLFLGSAEESVLQQAAQLAGPRGIPIVSTESFITAIACVVQHHPWHKYVWASIIISARSPFLAR